jgi:hypothetical protein
VPSAPRAGPFFHFDAWTFEVPRRLERLNAVIHDRRRLPPGLDGQLDVSEVVLALGVPRSLHYELRDWSKCRVA